MRDSLPTILGKAAKQEPCRLSDQIVEAWRPTKLLEGIPFCIFNCHRVLCHILSDDLI